ncbi:MAG TPA: hypothetical protein VK968_03180 [Roseimicrobium sp.]|nr:hypothetical protein [Roseimicrobium sp.]
MNNSKSNSALRAGMVLGGTLLILTLTGCVGYVDGPHARVYVPPPPSVHVDVGIEVQDDYVYYPSYQVYYSSTRHHYIYLEGRTWVNRPSPPRVSASVLLASPSVRLEFHDAPSVHHSRVVKQYPKHWAPPGQQKSNHGQDKKDDKRDDDKDHGNGKGKGNRK